MKDQTFRLKLFDEKSFSSKGQFTGGITKKSSIFSISYELSGNLSKILLPKKAERSTRKNELWKKTCFEFFIAIWNQPQYWEFNLSPSGAWNVYSFRSYRDGMKEEPAFTELPFTTRRCADSFLLDLECDLEKIIPQEQPLEIAVSAVIKDRDNRSAYWALTHRGSKPDFHSRDCFTVILPADSKR